MKNHIKEKRPVYVFPGDYLPYLVARASFAILHDFHSLLKPARMRVPEWRVLAKPVGGRRLYGGRACPRDAVQAADALKLLDRLERRGLVRRVAGAWICGIPWSS